MLRDTCTLLKQQGIRLVLANVSPLVRDQFDRYGITEALGVDAIYGSVHAVVAAYERQSAGSAGSAGATTGETGGGPPA